MLHARKQRLVKRGLETFHFVLFKAFVLFAVWEEEAVWNEDFLSLFPAITVNKFAAVELKMLNLMQFEVCVVSGGLY